MVPFNDVMLPPQRAMRWNIKKITFNTLPENEYYHCEALVIVWMTE